MLGWFEDVVYDSEYVFGESHAISYGCSNGSSSGYRRFSAGGMAYAIGGAMECFAGIAK